MEAQMLFDLRKHAESLDTLIDWLEQKSRGSVKRYPFSVPDECALAQFFTEMYGTPIRCTPTFYYEDAVRGDENRYRRLPQHFNDIVMGSADGRSHTFAQALKRARAIRKRVPQ
jgi:hypothetical protein